MGSSHTSNQIYLLQNCFSNYLYLKDMCMTFKEIRKILFASVLRILFNLNFTAVFTKKELDLIEYIQLILPFIAFEEDS